MTNNDFIGALQEAHTGYATLRREAISLSSEIQTLSKRAIFALQRGETAMGSELISAAGKHIAEVRKKAESDVRLAGEGSYRAALEEYAEAEFFRQVLEEDRITAVDGLDEETQIGGLSDMIGEVVRRMTVLVTEGNLDGARALKKAVEPVMEGLNRMDYRGGLRSKYDQAVRHYRKAEDILYDISLRG